MLVYLGYGFSGDARSISDSVNRMTMSKEYRPYCVSKNRDKNDANEYIALGTGVGVLGAMAAAVTGAICPLCIIVAPALAGYGVFKRWRCSQVEHKNELKPIK